MIAMAIGVGKIREEIPDADLGAGVWLTVVGWVFALLVPFLVSGGGKRFFAVCCNTGTFPVVPGNVARQQPSAGMPMQPMQSGATFMQQPTMQMQQSTWTPGAFEVQNSKFSTSYPQPSTFAPIPLDASMSVPIAGPQHRILHITKADADAQLMQVRILHLQETLIVFQLINRRDDHACMCVCVCRDVGCPHPTSL